MGKLAGCALILSGLTLAGLTLPFADQLDARTMPAPEAVAAAAVAAAPAPGLARPAASLTGNDAGRVASFAPVAAKDLAPAEAAPRKPVGAFQTVTVPNDPVQLARALQQELRRAGCYDGEINGVWSPASRKAMKALTDRINASLPVDRPDFILLSLAQAQSDKVCSQQCPPGQGLGDNGRCLPQAVLAHSRKGPTPARVAHVTPPTNPGAVARTDGQIKLNSGQPVIAPPAPTAQAPLPAPRALSPQFQAETPRMALAGPTIPSATDLKPEPGTQPQATQPLAHPQPDKAQEKARERKAQRERDKERRVAREKSPAFGQTRWAREFFKRGDGAI